MEFIDKQTQIERDSSIFYFFKRRYLIVLFAFIALFLASIYLTIGTFSDPDTNLFWRVFSILLVLYCSFCLFHSARPFIQNKKQMKINRLNTKPVYVETKVILDEEQIRFIYNSEMVQSDCTIKNEFIKKIVVKDKYIFVLTNYNAVESIIKKDSLSEENMDYLKKIYGDKVSKN